MSPSGKPSLPAWLNARYIPWAAGLLVLAFAAAAAGLLAYERHEIEANELGRVETFARVFEDHANRTFNGAEIVLSAAAQALEANPGQTDPARLSPQLRDLISGLPYLRSLSVLDASGRVLASSNPDNVDLLLPLDRLSRDGRATPAGLGPLLPGRDLAALAAAPAAAGALSQLPLTLAVRGPQRLLMVGVLNPDYFANQYQLILGSLPLRAALLSYGNQLVAATENVPLAPGQALAGHPLFQEFLPLRESGHFFGSGLDGQPALGALRSTRRHPMVVLVELPATQLDQTLGEVARVVVGATAAAALTIIALSLLAWRSLRSHQTVSSALASARGTVAAQHEFTERLFEATPVPMAIKDPDGNFMRANRAFLAFTGLSREQLLGHNFGAFYPPELAAPHEVQEQMAIASGQPLSYEEQLLDRDGLPRDVVVRMEPYTAPDGSLGGLITCLMDVTEFRDAERRTLEAKDAAERANNAKSEFVANISHELRTPLQTILGFSELGRARARGEPRLQAMFGDIHGAGQRMLELVNNLLDLSRIDSTVGSIRLTRGDIEPALREVLRELEQLAADRGLALAAPAPGRPLPAEADPLRLQQVLRNVLANAIRFAPAGTALEIDWGPEADGGALIRVRDHGPGIPSDELESIFEAFVQSSRTKDGSGGTGLGLAICRKIMAAHRGSIRAHNHPQGGAVFEIRLPPPGDMAGAAA